MVAQQRLYVDDRHYRTHASGREELYAELQPLVRRLVRRYSGDDAELRHDLHGEIYCRYCALFEAFDETRGVPLRPYLIRQLSASVYTYARQQWRARMREVSLDVNLEDQHTDAPELAHGAPMLRANGTNASGAGFWSASDTQTGSSDWDDAMVFRDMAQCLPAYIERLPARQKQVLLWRCYEHRSFADIAQSLEIKEATVRSLLRHAITNLRRSFGPLEEAA
jgi:RNA polymerase sigma factor (sigma-70 family)